MSSHKDELDSLLDGLPVLTGDCIEVVQAAAKAIGVEVARHPCVAFGGDTAEEASARADASVADQADRWFDFAVVARWTDHVNNDPVSPGMPGYRYRVGWWSAPPASREPRSREGQRSSLREATVGAAGCCVRREGPS